MADKAAVLAGPNTFAIGDAIELISDIPGRKELKAGARGVVVVGNEPDTAAIWDMVSITLDGTREGGKAWLVRPRHLRRVGGDDDPPNGAA
jgi:hypothetical protein